MVDGTVGLPAARWASAHANDSEIEELCGSIDSCDRPATAAADRSGQASLWLRMDTEREKGAGGRREGAKRTANLRLLRVYSWPQ